MSEPDAKPDGARAIGPLTAVFLVVASMVGTGVFTTSGLLLEALSSAPAVLLAWALGGVLALAGALTYAELATALPHNGGEYHLLSRVYHPALGFASGVVSFVVGFCAPIAASALAFGHYLHLVAPSIGELPAAVALVLGMSATQLLDVRLGSRVQDALTVFKIVLVLGVIALAVASVDAERLTAGARPLFEAALSPAMAVGLVYVSFSYTGWNAAVYIAGEVRSPATTLPRALVIGTLLVTLLYLALNLVFLGVAPAEALSGEVAVGHVAATAALGRTGGATLSLVIALGLVSTVGALVFTGARVLDAMGRDHARLAFFRVRNRAGGPWVSALVQGALSLLMVLTASFDALLTYAGLTLSLFAGITVAGVFVLRHREPGLARPYRTFGYPITPLLFVALMIWMIAHSVIERPEVALFGAGTVALAAIGYPIVTAGSRPGSGPSVNGG